MNKLFVCIVALVAILVISSFLVACTPDVRPAPDEGETTDPVPSDVPTLPEETHNDVTAVPLDESTFQQMLQAAKLRLSNNEQLTMRYNWYLEYYVKRQLNLELSAETISITEEQIIINETSGINDIEAVQYLIMLSEICEKYSDCIVWIDYKYDETYSRLMIADLFVCPSFHTSGYETMTEFYEAVAQGTISRPEDSYLVSFEWPKIIDYSTGVELDLF